MKIVFLDAASMGTTPLDPIARQGEFTAWYNSTPEQALERVGDCEVLIVNKVRVTEELLAAAPKVRLVCEAGTGINNIDVDACSRRGIAVRNVAGYSTCSVAQQTFMHILNLMGNGRYFDDVVKSGHYSRTGMLAEYSELFTEIDGKTLGIIGMGAIGSKVAHIGEAFGMKIMYYSTSGTGHCTEYPCVPLERLMSESDVISINAPYNERTAGLVGEKELRIMKPTAIIVNAGRGGIIDDAALAKVLDEGVIGGAGLDVYSKEPLPADHPLLKVKRQNRLSLTPHIAWASKEAGARLIDAMAANIAEESAGWQL